MATARAWIAGIGCLVVAVALLIVVLMAIGMQAPGLPGKMVLSIDFDAPIVEVAAPDPFAELAGEAPMSLRDLRTVLLAAADDDRVEGIRMRIHCCLPGPSTIQEIRALLERVRAAGKWTEVWMDTVGEFQPGNLEYYLASGCDEISVGPMADVNIVGLTLQVPFYRGTFEKLGIEPDFRGRGDYKTARYSYTRTEMTDAQEEMMQWLLDSLSEQYVSDLASGRGMEPAEVRNLIDQAPFLAGEALEAGLVDRIEGWGEFRDRITSERAPGAKVVSAAAYLEGAAGRQRGPKIAVVTATGAIMRGESRRELNPLFGGDVMGADTIARAFRSVRSTPGVKAVVFRVDSPGGSAVASETIRREMLRTAEELPVVVSMSSVAASGGYWISAGAQRIVAAPATLTASIGVFAGHLDMERFWNDKLGVTFGEVSFGENSDIYGTLGEWDASEEAEIEKMLDRIYAEFLARVSEGRNMTVEEVDAVGRGRVFTGVQAVELGLVDVVGGFDVALDEARTLAGLDPGADVELVDFPKAVTWWQRLLRRGREEDLALRELRALVEAAWRTGTLPAPGAAWTPPITVE